MHYLGGKVKVAKGLCAAINAALEADARTAYYEPFVGGGSVLQGILPRVPRYASDLHPDLIDLWRALQAGWVPPDALSIQEYYALKDSPPTALRGFAGFGCSFSGKWFGGYARDDPSHGAWYAGAAKRGLLRKVAKMGDVQFACCSYLELAPFGALIYCDPPYAGTTGYAQGAFDHGAFAAWCRVQAQRENTVLVSEYEPLCADWVEVWSALPYQKSLGARRPERLFRVPP